MKRNGEAREIESEVAQPNPLHLRFVAHLPDLITYEDYLADPDKKKIRLRITVTEDGIEILGDSMYAPLLEELLGNVGAQEIERMLCG